MILVSHLLMDLGFLIYGFPAWVFDLLALFLGSDPYLSATVNGLKTAL